MLLLLLLLSLASPSAPVSLHFRSYCCPFPGAHSSPVSCSPVSFLLPAFPAPYICLASSLHAAAVLRVGPPRPLHPNSSALVPRPDLIDFDKLKDSNARHNLEHAFDVAERQLGIIPLLDPEGEPHPLSSLPGLVQVPGKLQAWRCWGSVRTLLCSSVASGFSADTWLMGRILKALGPPSFCFWSSWFRCGSHHCLNSRASAQFFRFF